MFIDLTKHSVHIAALSQFLWYVLKVKCYEIALPVSINQSTASSHHSINPQCFGHLYVSLSLLLFLVLSVAVFWYPYLTAAIIFAGLTNRNRYETGTTATLMFSAQKRDRDQARWVVAMRQSRCCQLFYAP